jgi:hypothetical protein
MGTGAVEFVDAGWASAGVVAAALLVVGLVMVWGAWSRARRRTAVLRQIFGAEYTRSVAGNGNRARAEAELTARLRRGREVWLRDLDPSERERFEAAWEVAGSVFVESPVGALREADVLIGQVMAERGYPIEGLEERVGLLSLEYPDLAGYLRAAHRVAVLAEQGKAADTEQMRQALVAYRQVLDALLGNGGSVGASEG